MTSSTTYSISSIGAVESGFDVDSVISAFASVFSVPPEKATAFVEKQKLIKKGLCRKDAEIYRQRLTQIGMSVMLNEHTADGIKPLPTPPNAKSHGLSLVQVDDVSVGRANNAATTQFSCPKCQLAQEKSEQCTGCEIYFEKFRQAEPAFAGTTSKPHSSGDATIARSRTANRVRIEEDDDDALSIASIALPLVAAVVGAFVWKLIAVAFGYELGLVAWGIGGAVGAAAAMAGGRGTGIGIVCALLALMAIFGGKYMTMASYQSDMVELFSGEDGVEGLQAVYDEVDYDAKAFVKIQKNDDSIKAFMVEHEYSDAKAGLFVTDSELSDFREYTQPWLEDHIDAASGESGWDDSELLELEQSVAEVSTSSLVIESLGPLDLLFLFLGLSTAFQLGRAGRSS